MHRSTLLTSKTLLLLTGALTLCAVISAGGANPAVSPADLNPLPIELDRGAAGLLRSLAELRTRASILMVTAHPDDEDGGLLTYMTRGIGARGVLMTLTRGEGGQNEMSDDLYDALGLLRTQELLAADRYYGVEQYWGTVIDYGFSKTREEALEKWGYDRVLGDVVRVIRMTRPLVIMSVFAGAPTDGHGNHQVSGQMAQEAFAAASDPNQFPEQMHEGLRPWSPAKVYARVPFFEATDKGIYDYATDKYVPVRFYDYVNKTWINKRPDATVEIPEGRQDPVTGLTFLQMGREGLGEQRSQNGGLTIPPAVPSLARYHRYGTRVNAPEHETSVYDGIDVSLEGIASATEHAPRFLAEGLQELAKTVNAATDAYRPSDPSAVAPSLAEGLRQARGLLEEVQNSDIPEPGRSDIAFELELKTKEFEHALLQALAVSLQAYIAPDKEPAGPFAAFAGPAPTFTVAIPGQSFSMKAHVMNGGREAVHMEGVDIAPTDGTDWQIHAEHAAPVEIAPEKDTTLHFTGKVSVDAQLTRAYFARPDQEQPYYNLLDERYRNLSFAPSPLIATAHFRYRGEELAFRTDVETMHRVEGIGIKANPLIVGPAISVQISPSAGAVPLNCDSFALSKNSRKTVAVSSAPPKEQANECTDSWRAAAPFALSCNLRSNVKGNAKGILRLRLPEGWRADPDQYAFELERDGDTDNVTFHVEPKNIKAEGYEIRAIAEYGGHTYAEGYRWTGYPGVRPYPYYRPATYKAVGVDVTTAPALRIAFVPGTGDDVPHALESLGVNVRIVPANDLDAVNLSDFNAVVLGVRAYAVQPALRELNAHLLEYVKNGGTLLVQYNLQSFDGDYGPYPFSLGNNAAKVVDENSNVKFLAPDNPLLNWPNKITEADFRNWQEERGHGFMQKWDPKYTALVETHDPDQEPQAGGLLVARYGKGIYIYDAFALYRQLPEGVPGAYRILANLVSAGKNPGWK